MLIQQLLSLTESASSKEDLLRKLEQAFNSYEDITEPDKDDWAAFSNELHSVQQIEAEFRRAVGKVEKLLGIKLKVDGDKAISIDDGYTVNIQAQRVEDNDPYTSGNVVISITVNEDKWDKPDPFKKRLGENIEPRFKIKWVRGYGENNGKSEVHLLSWFSDDNGFDDDLQTEIKNLDVGQEIRSGGPSDTIVITRVSDKTQLTEAAPLVEKVFDNDKYDWYVWTNRSPSEPFERRGGAKQIEKGQSFGLRAATSKPGTWRMIMKGHGPSIIFSITAAQAQTLMDRALKLRD